MPTFPTFTHAYTLEGYSYEVAPEVTRTQYYTGNARQRKHFQKRDDLFTIRLVLSNAELTTFENFVATDLENGSLTFDGPYFTSDIEYTGTLELVNGEYRVAYLTPDYWEVTYQCELKNRSMTNEDGVYSLIEGLGTFDAAYNIFDALEDMVNNNNL